MPPRRFPPPWSIEKSQESFIVKDANGQQLAYLYFEDEPQRQMSMKRLSRDEAFLIALNIAKLPSVQRQILKAFRCRQIRPAGTIERHSSQLSLNANHVLVSGNVGTLLARGSHTISCPDLCSCQSGQLF
jgi:hypothetical protein